MATRAFDVIVCGGGGAGLAAAIEAADAGATVAVFERSPELGGSTALSGGAIGTVNDAAGAVEHYYHLTEGRTPRSVIEAYVDGLGDLPAWFHENGYETEPQPLRAPVFPPRHAGSAYPDVPHASAIGERIKVCGSTHGGTAIVEFLRDALRRRPQIEVHVGAAVASLQRDGARVAGVQTSAGESIIARSGVILTTGGFAWDEALVRDSFGEALPGFGPPGKNCGDGIRLAQSAGAALWHMTALATGFGYVTPDHDAAWMCKLASRSFMLVDQTGRRYTNEMETEAHAAAAVLLQRDVGTGRRLRFPSLLIFDEETRISGPIATDEVGANRELRWSADNSDEIRKGWITQANSVVELAAKVGLLSTNLQDSFLAYGDGSRPGGMDQFGRTIEDRPPFTPPYYAIEVFPALLNTQGGPQRDEHARIIGAKGGPIPGLYGAGELGSLWCDLYPGAGNVSEAMVFGRIAGRSAARGI